MVLDEGVDAGGDWEVDDLGIEDDLADDMADAAAGAGAFYFPNPGRSMQRQWVENSQLAVDHIAAGAFESAIPVCLTHSSFSASHPPLGGLSRFAHGESRQVHRISSAADVPCPLGRVFGCLVPCLPFYFCEQKLPTRRARG